jgi:hypothetical protein
MISIRIQIANPQASAFGFSLAATFTQFVALIGIKRKRQLKPPPFSILNVASFDNEIVEMRTRGGVKLSVERKTPKM